MKKTVIGICISLLCVGTGVYVNQQSNASSPVVSTVAKSTKDSKVNTNESKTKVSKHEEAEETEKLEEVGNATNSETEQKTDAASKESSSVKAEDKSSAKAGPKSSVSSEGKKQTSSNQTKTSGTTKKDNSTVSSSSTGTSKEPETKPVEKPSKPVPEHVVESTPTPEPARPSYACPGGVNQDVACNVILDQNHYFATYSSQAEADAASVYYMNEVMYIGETEITNYSVQVVYRNDHSIAYYGLNPWSNGSLIQ